VVEVRVGLRAPGAPVDESCEDKAEIGESVEVPNDTGIDRLRACQRNASAFCPAAHGSCQVKGGPAGSPAWQDELGKRGELHLKCIDRVLEPPDVGAGEGRDVPGGGIGAIRQREVRAHREEIVLDLPEDLSYGEGKRFAANHPQNRVEFVDGSICLDARGVFRDPSPADQPGGSIVSGFRVYPRHVSSWPGRRFPLTATALSANHSTVKRPGALRVGTQLFIGIAAVSCGSIFVRLAAAPALAVAAYRTIWATVLFTPFLVSGPSEEIRRLDQRNGLLLGLSGAALALHFALWIASLSYTSVASSVLLVDTTPFFIGMTSRWFLGRSAGRAFWTGLATAFAGCIIIFGGDWAVAEDSMVGNLLALGGAVAMAAYLLVGARVRRHLSLIAYVWPVYGSAALVLTASCAIAGTALTGYSGRTHFFLFLLGLVPQCIGHTTYNWSLRWLPPSLVALIGLAEPLGASILAWLILGEALTTVKIAGGLVVLAGIYIATRPAKTMAA